VIKGLEFLFNQFSARGLPLILKAGWDDARGYLRPQSHWRIWAECCGDWGDKAYEILHRMMPATRHAAAPEIYRVEPYVACQFIYGPESDQPGDGPHSWATGTAAWRLIVVWEWMPGVRPELDGLWVDPHSAGC
jgi:cellobiose phosphorylase